MSGEDAVRQSTSICARCNQPIFFSTFFNEWQTKSVEADPYEAMVNVCLDAVDNLHSPKYVGLDEILTPSTKEVHKRRTHNRWGS